MGASIITPVYNGSHYIIETVESVLSQIKHSSVDFEYIVLDDGSTDDTLKKLAPYQDRLTLLKQTNMGEQATVNKGIGLAKHDIVAVVNADDPVFPGLLETAVKMLNDNKDLVAVYPDWKKIDEEGKTIEEVRTQEFDYNLMLEQYCCIPGPGTFFRRSALKGEKPRNTQYRYSGDFELWLRLGLQGPMKRIPQFLASWRHHGAGASQKCISPEMAINRIAVMKNFYKRTDLPANVLAKKNQAISAAYYQAGFLALHNPKVPGRRYLLLSFWYALRWPENILKLQRRNRLYIVYIFGSPFTRIAYWCLRKFKYLKNKDKVYA